MHVSTETGASNLDRHSSDSRLFSRGYLELLLDEQFCDGASPADAEGKRPLTLTLYILDKDDTQVEARVFPTRVAADISDETRRKLLVKFMDRLVNVHSVSAFTRPNELDPEELEGFKSEIELATANWV